MMQCFAKVFGEDAIFGSKFPMLDRVEMMARRGDRETDEEYNARQYSLLSRDIVPAKWNGLKPEGSMGSKKTREIEKSLDMNPKGFWESRWSVQGAAWFPGVDNIVKGKEVCKIVSNGLATSDPQYVSRVVFMARCPREVARSQERLTRRTMEFNGREIGEDIVVHSPVFFINATVAAANWIVNVKPEIMVVRHSEMISHPESALGKVGEFVGQNMDAAVSCVRPKLYRSEPRDKIGGIWDVADAIYDCIEVGDFKGVLDIMSDEEARRELSREVSSWVCERNGLQVNHAQCRECMRNDTVAWNYRDLAERNRIDWESKPCLYECGFSRDHDEHKTLAESVKENHWEKLESRGAGDTLSKVLKKVKLKPCGGCKKRQSRLNKLIPYKKKA
jgi:hypothetical protein